jgi:hypothetical protein
MTGMTDAVNDDVADNRKKTTRFVARRRASFRVT